MLMSRQQRSGQRVAEIADRFVAAVQDHLNMTPSDLWRLLGYANPSTIQAVRRGEALPDFVRIAEHQSELRDGRGRTLNLHWVITGEGRPMMLASNMQRKMKEDGKIDNDIIIKIREMTPAKRAALVKFLFEFT